MKKFVKIAAYIVGVLVLFIIAGLIFFNSRYPDVDKPRNVKVEITPERLKRGEYLLQVVWIVMAKGTGQNSADPLSRDMGLKEGKNSVRKWDSPGIFMQRI